MTQLVERQNYGWLPDIPDHRDRLFKLSASEALLSLPPRFDLREFGKSPIYDQGNLGSCVANAVAGAIEFAMSQRPNDPKVSDFVEAKRVFEPNRLFIYYGAREIIGLTGEDSGCHIRDAMKVVYNQGAPRETGWKYSDAGDKFSKRPPKAIYKSAPYHKITSYKSVPVEVNAIKAALAEKLPVIFGVAVFNSFFANSNGNIPMPGFNEQMLGGHAMRAMDWDDSTQTFGFDNSWGTSWGTNGRGRIPYQYLGNPRLGADYWILEDQLYKERMDA